jgi:hypothetical protein
MADDAKPLCARPCRSMCDGYARRFPRNISFDSSGYRIQPAANDELDVASSGGWSPRLAMRPNTSPPTFLRRRWCFGKATPTRTLASARRCQIYRSCGRDKIRFPGARYSDEYGQSSRGTQDARPDRRASVLPGAAEGGRLESDRNRQADKTLLIGYTSASRRSGAPRALSHGPVPVARSLRSNMHAETTTLHRSR